MCVTDKIDQELIQTATKSHVISQLAVAYGNIDIGAATARTIPIEMLLGVLTNATADLTWALLMA
jgi:glyoxylate reductase